MQRDIEERVLSEVTTASALHSTRRPTPACVDRSSCELSDATWWRRRRGRRDWGLAPSSVLKIPCDCVVRDDCPAMLRTSPRADRLVHLGEVGPRRPLGAPDSWPARSNGPAHAMNAVQASAGGGLGAKYMIRYWSWCTLAAQRISSRSGPTTRTAADHLGPGRAPGRRRRPADGERSYWRTCRRRRTARCPKPSGGRPPAGARPSRGPRTRRARAGRASAGPVVAGLHQNVAGTSEATSHRNPSTPRATTREDSR